MPHRYFANGVPARPAVGPPFSGPNRILSAMTAAQSPHIVTVVLNSISHDTRVLKEADTLANGGYQVTIVGIKDNYCDDDLTVFPSGVRAVRVECRDKFASIAKTSGVAWRFLRRILVITVCGTLFVYLPDLIRQIREWLTLSQQLFAIGVVVGLAMDIMASRSAGGRERGGRQGVGIRARIVEAFRRRLRLWVYHTTLTAKVQQLAPDAIHLHDVTTLPVGLRYRRHGGTAKLIFDSHELFEDLPNASWWHKRRTRSLQNRIAPLLSGMVTINESIASKLVSRHPGLPKPVIVKNAARLPDTSITDDGRLREAADLRPGVRILLYQGGFSINRGLETLVQAAPLLPDDWVLVMMGWGKLEKVLRLKAQALGTGANRIRFVGRAPQAELVYWTAGADLGVIPYANIGLNHWYCTPNKLWEYPAAGVPILASPFPELSRIVEGEGIGALLDDPVTPQGIADAVAGMTDERLKSLRTACSSFIARDNWSVYADRLLDLYGRVLGPVSSQVEIQPTLVLAR